VADELAKTGDFKKIANYGEYSGNPSEDETYTYTSQLISLLLKSNSPRKILLIAGGVANFTDVAKTFAGIIRAIERRAQQMAKQDVIIFVRRGGPNQEAGLNAMKNFLEEIKLKHEIYGPEFSLADIAAKVAKVTK